MPLTPSTSQPLRSQFGAILLAIRARLATTLSLPEETVKLIGRNNTQAPKLTSQQDVLVRPSRFPVVEKAGRIDTRFVRTIYIFPRVQLMLDEVDRDEVFLTGEQGIFGVEEAIANALCEWFPVDSAQNQLTIHGLKLANGSEPDKDMPTDPMWGDSCLAFEATYHPPIQPGNFGILN